MKKNVIKIICVIMCLTFLLSGCSLLGSKNSIGFQASSLAGVVQNVSSDGTVNLLIGEIKGDDSSDNQEADNETDTEVSDETETSEDDENSEDTETTDETDEIETSEETTDDSESEDLEDSQNVDSEENDTSESDEGISDTEDSETLTNGVEPSGTYFVASNVAATLTLGDTSVLFKGSSDTAVGIDAIEEGNVLQISLDDKNEISKVEILSIPVLTEINGIKYFAANTFSDDNEFSDETFESTNDDENAVIVSGESTVGFDNVSISRSSSNSNGGIVSQTYGVGAALLVSNGRSYIINSTIDTDANGATAIYSYGDSEVYTSNTQIVTENDNSNGLVTSTGKLAAWDMTISTSGDNSSAIKSTNDGGVIVAEGGTYSTSGNNSSALYSSADLAISEATVSSENSEVACVEGKNSIYIFDSALSSNLSGDDSSAVLVYQKDDDNSNSRAIFSMVGGTLDAENCGLIYTTNTQSKITLSDVDITVSEDCPFFLKCTGNDGTYGENGSNGASCIFTGVDQKMTGNVIWDSISKLDFYMQGESELTGSINNNDEDDSGKGYCKVYISDGAKWIVTGDSSVTELYCEGEIVDADGNTVTIKDTDGKTLVSGNSEFTITVESYDDSVSLDGANTVPVWDDYKIERPSGI